MEPISPDYNYAAEVAQSFKLLRIIAIILLIVGGGLASFIGAILIYEKIIFALQNWDYKLYKLKEMASLEHTVELLIPTQAASIAQIQSSNIAGPSINTEQIAKRKKTKPTTRPKTTNGSTSPRTEKPASITFASDYAIIIPKIGVKTEILRKGTVKKRMVRGVAIYNDYGTPDHNELPIILSSHRFGYAWWTPSYRRTHSFHNLDKLKLGDKIYIKWKGKWYIYKVNRKYVDRRFRNFDTDLIMYTCVDYFNPNRIIVEATRIK